MRISDWSSDVCSSDLLFTHAHADHCHGLDELRGLVYGRGAPIDAYMDARTRKLLTTRVDYAFVSSRAERNLYPALLHDRVIEGPFSTGGLPVQPFGQPPGPAVPLGSRLGDTGSPTAA